MEYVVIMIEPRYPGEPKMTVSEQINEVFGPMKEKEAEDFMTRMETVYNIPHERSDGRRIISPRKWLMIPLSDINVIDFLEEKAGLK